MRLIIIASSGRAIAASANCAGFSFCLVDQFCDWDAVNLALENKNSNHQFHRIDRFEQLDDLLDSIEGDGVILGGGIEGHIQWVKRIEQRFRLLATSSEQLERLTHVNSLPVLKAAINKGGGKWPESIPYFPDQTSSQGWLVKNLMGGGGSGIHPWDFAIRSKVNRTNQAIYFQQKIDGFKLSALYVSVSRVSAEHQTTHNQQDIVCHLIGCTEQLVGVDWLGAAEFGYCGSIGPLPIGKKIHSVLSSIGRRVATEFRLKGLFGIDLMVNHEGLWPVDINPRITASAELFERWTHQYRNLNNGEMISIAKMQVDSCLGKDLNVPNLSNQQLRNHQLVKGVLFHHGAQPLHINERRFRQLIKLKGSTSAEDSKPFSLADIPHADTIIQPRSPLLTLFTSGRNRDEAKKNLKRHANAVKDLIYYDSVSSSDRNSIGA